MQIIRDTSGTIRQVKIIDLHGDPTRPLVIDGNWLEIDGNGAYGPLVLLDCSHLIVQRFMPHNAKKNTAVVHCENCEDVEIRETLAWDAGDGNAFPWLVWKSQRVRLTDCAGWGRGRKVFQWYCSDDCTAVRCWGRWGGMTTPDPGSSGVFAPAYNCFRTTMLNCIGVVESDDPQLVNAAWLVDSMDLPPWQGHVAECAVDGSVAICRVPRDCYHIGSPRAITYTNCVRSTDKPIAPGSNAGTDAKTMAGRILLAKLEMQWRGSPIVERIKTLAGADPLSDVRSIATPTPITP